ncbi:GMC oxidoreductase [Aestuariivirga sp.]|uniref:GMC oxidoreductase n=1 Tax=Aestuariivirga sp. TaxID=2650926 RepID=UPI0037842ED4
MERLRSQGLHPFPQQASIYMPPSGGCIRCGTCDGYPCQIDAKADAEMSTLRPALAMGHVVLRKSTLVRRLLLNPDGKSIAGVEVEQDGRTEVLTAKTYVLSASAINSAAILLHSATDAMPNGLANSSDQVGRNYMTHNNSAMMAVGARKNATVFQKTVTINDYYFGDDEFRWPMGCLMSLGKLRAGVMTAANPLVPQFVNELLAQRSFDWWIMSEDLPSPENRITVSGGTIKMDVRRNNLRAHQELTKRASRAMKRAGLPLILTKLMPVATTSHQCGTARFGTDPQTSVLDPFCRSWDHHNLFVIDASFFPSSAAVNPALTIAAQALRAASHIAGEDFGISSPH